MNIITNNDSYAEAFSIAMFSSTPFITIGQLWSPAVMYVSSAIGIIFLILFLGRILFTLNSKRTTSSSPWISEMISQLSLPYFIALSSLILVYNEVDASAGLWFSLAYTLIVFTCLPLLKQSKA